MLRRRWGPDPYCLSRTRDDSHNPVIRSTRWPARPTWREADGLPTERRRPRSEPVHRICAAHRGMAASAGRRGEGRHHRDARPAGETERAHLRGVRRPPRPARRTVAPRPHPGPGARGRGARVLLGRRRGRDHRRHPADGHRPAAGVQPDDRPGRPRPAGGAVPCGGGRAGGGGGRGRGARTRGGLPGGRPHRARGSPSSSPASASPAGTWAPPTCCPGWSGSATPPAS